MKKCLIGGPWIGTAVIVALSGVFLLVSGCAGSRTSSVDKQYQRAVEQQRLKTEILDEPDIAQKLPPVDNPKMLEQKGDHYLRLGKDGMAFIEYQKAIEADPSQVRVRLKLANLLLKRKMWAEALVEFETVEKQSPNNIVALQGKAAALIQLNRLEEAEQILNTAIAADTGLWQAYALLGNLYERQELYERAIEAYEKTLAINPKAAAIYNKLGTSLSMARKYREAADVLLKAVRLGVSNSETYNKLGLALFKMEMFPDAYEAFKKGGDEAEAYNKMAILFMGTKDYARAIEFYEKAIDAKPTYYKAAYDGLQNAKNALKAEKIAHD